MKEVDVVHAPMPNVEREGAQGLQNLDFVVSHADAKRWGQLLDHLAYVLKGDGALGVGIVERPFGCEELDRILRNQVHVDRSGLMAAVNKMQLRQGGWSCHQRRWC